MRLAKSMNTSNRNPAGLLPNPLAATLLGVAAAAALSVPRLATAEAMPINEKYSVNCIACHGPDLKGVEGLGINLTDSKFVAAESLEQLVAFLKVGRLPDDPASRTGRPMPGFSWIAEADLKEIAEYIKKQHAP